MIWKCPNCNEPLQQDNRQLKCSNNHSFDIAKQGYTNLLLDNQKKSKNPGDNDEMLEARQRFLQAGFYDPLIKAIQPYIKPNHTIIDLGCGEGYYLRQLLTQEPDAKGYGIDIAKTGVKKAAQQSKALQPYIAYAVGSTYRAPVIDHSCDVAISIFAPFDEQDVQRILKDEGLLIRVGPATKHHQEIKEKLYQNAEEFKPASIPEGFQITHQEELLYEIELSGKALTEDLIPMTPFHWQGSQEAKAALAALSSQKITVHFQVDVLSAVPKSV